MQIVAIAIAATLAFAGVVEAQPYKVATASVTMFPLPTPSSNAIGITAGPDGNVWFEEHIGRIGRITPSGAITEFALPPSTAMGASITSGPDGNLWFIASSTSGNIARMTTSGAVSFFNVGIQSPFPVDLVSGPDGNLWVTVTEHSAFGFLGGDFADPYIDRVRPSGSVDAYFPLARINFETGLIVKGVNGDLWFTEFEDSHIGRIATNGIMTEFDTPGPSKVVGADDIAVAPDGNVWLTKQGALFRMTPQGAFTPIWDPSNGAAYHVFIGPDQNVWFSVNLGSVWAIAFIAGASITVVPLPASPSPSQITVGSDGNIWFTSVGSNAIGRLDVASIAAVQNAPALSPLTLLFLAAALSIVGILALSR